MSEDGVCENVKEENEMWRWCSADGCAGWKESVDQRKQE